LRERLAGFSFLKLFTFVATFVQAWYAMTGRRFLTLEA
jgi:hypothetical protein